MSIKAPRLLSKATYDREALLYSRSLPLEHSVESKSQSTQDNITMVSLGLVADERDDFYVFSEMLIQYPVPGLAKTGKVCPDNMVVISTEPIEAESSFNIPLEPAMPFWVMEYVSPNSKRKDYVDSYQKYETILKVPYYLIYEPDEPKLTLLKHDGSKYEKVEPNERGRYSVDQLNIEVALVDGWVRFWYKGKLLPLPAEMQREIKKTKKQVKAQKQRADEENARALAEKQRADQENARALAEKQRADQENARALAEKQRADQENARAEAEKQRADEEKARAEAEKRRADELEQKLAQLQQELAAMRSGKRNGTAP